MVEPIPVLVQSPFEPAWKLSEMVNKLVVQVLNTPFNLAFVLRIRWMRKMSFNTVFLAPLFPVFLELRTVIRKYDFTPS
jgi:hypothetical protein